MDKQFFALHFLADPQCGKCPHFRPWLTKKVQKLALNWPQKGFKMVEKSHKSGSKLVSKVAKKIQKLDKKSAKNNPKVVQK